MKSASIIETPDKKNLESALRDKQIQLNALLDITLAINENLGVKGLWQKFENLFAKKIGVDRLAIYNAESGWQCIQFRGVTEEFAKKSLKKEVLSFSQITKLKKGKTPFAEFFEIAIPVFHKDQPLVVVFMGKSDDEKYLHQEERISFIQTITNIVVVANENKKLVKEQLKQQSIRKELEFGGTMQTMLIPKKFPKNEYIDIAACYIPNLDVGGDYYDYIELNDEEIIFCIGDISGKGVAAALLMANFQASFRSLARSMNFLDEMVIELNNRVNEITQGEKYVTFFVCRYNYNSRKLQYVNAGHTPPILLYKNEILHLEEGCTILGMFEKLPAVKVGKMKLSEPSFLFCFTDGLSDVENENDQVMNMGLMEQFIQRKAHLPVEEFNKIILDFVVEFKGTKLIGDDISFMSCKLL